MAKNAFPGNPPRCWNPGSFLMEGCRDGRHWTSHDRQCGFGARQRAIDQRFSCPMIWQAGCGLHSIGGGYSYPAQRGVAELIMFTHRTPSARPPPADWAGCKTNEARSPVLV